MVEERVVNGETSLREAKHGFVKGCDEAICHYEVNQQQYF
jgi:hypothetical protein